MSSSPIFPSGKNQGIARVVSWYTVQERSQMLCIVVSSSFVSLPRISHLQDRLTWMALRSNSEVRASWWKVAGAGAKLYSTWSIYQLGLLLQSPSVPSILWKEAKNIKFSPSYAHPQIFWYGKVSLKS